MTVRRGIAVAEARIDWADVSLRALETRRHGEREALARAMARADRAADEPEPVRNVRSIDEETEGNETEEAL